MKPYFVIVLFISMFLGKAQEQRTIKNIDEINLTEESDKNFRNYQKALGKNTLYQSFQISFSGEYIKENSVTSFSGKSEYNEKLVPRKTEINENLNKEEKEIVHKFLNQLYGIINFYYALSLDKQKILSEFYCLSDTPNVWFFKAGRKQIKENIGVNSADKLNFKVELDSNGKIRIITIFYDRVEKDFKNLKEKVSHQTILNFISYKDGIKPQSTEGMIVIPSNGNKIKFLVKFQ